MEHPAVVAASGMSEGAMPGRLVVSFRVEVDRRDKEGGTEGCGFSSKSRALTAPEKVITSS